MNQRPTKEFAIGLFAIGDIGSCLLSCFCPCIAIAQARYHLDHSDTCLNCCYMNPVPMRWITRSAYNIPGEWTEDCLCGICCTCCTVNQILQTTKAYGLPTPDAGREQNRNQFLPQTDSGSTCGNIMYSLCCMSCAIGTLLERTMNMPFFMGCCCANACIARNLSRYQYRIAGSDCVEDCFIPNLVGMCGFCCLVVSVVLPCCICCTAAIWPYMVAMLVTPLEESKVRGSPGYYLGPIPGNAAIQTLATFPGAIQQQPGGQGSEKQQLQYASTAVVVNPVGFNPSSSVPHEEAVYAVAIPAEEQQNVQKSYNQA